MIFAHMHTSRQILHQNRFRHMLLYILIHPLHQLMMNTLLLRKIKRIPGTKLIQIHKKQNQLRLIKQPLPLRPLQIRNLRHSRLHQQILKNLLIMHRKMIRTIPPPGKTPAKILLPLRKPLQHPLTDPKHNPPRILMLPLHIMIIMHHIPSN